MNRFTLLPIAVLLSAARPIIAASGCDAVNAAVIKVFQVPVHLYMTETAGFNGGKARNAETIYLNGATFVMVNGQWRKSVILPKDLLPKDLAVGKKESEEKAGTCSIVRDEAVSGEPATLYKVHNQTAAGTLDTQIWVSKSKGLALKQINDQDVGGGARGKMHTEISYEYTNVTAPAVTEPKRK
jgi:hypothetical protein